MNIPINYVAVLVAAAASFVVGFLWHGPLFGTYWLKLSGISEKEAREGAKDMNMAPRIIAAFLQQLVMAFVVAHFVYLVSATDIVAAAVLAFWIWLGFIVTVLLNGVLWEKRTMNLYVFNIVYHFVALFVMTAILAMWR